MYVQNGVVVTSASDLTAASDCEFAFLRKLDIKLGRDALFIPDTSAMLARAGTLGTVHEAAVLNEYRRRFGDGVVEIAQPDVFNEAAVDEAVARTNAAFESAAPVVFQATFATERFIGFADFIVRQPSGRYRVQDAKLARRAKVTALLQLAAYAEQLERVGVPIDETAELLLGDGSSSAHRLADITPVYRRRAERLTAIITERETDTQSVRWGDERYTACGRCPTCAAEVDRTHDVLGVGGMRMTQRERLLAAGISTIDELATSIGSIDGVLDSTLENLRAQARLQLTTERARESAEATRADAAGTEPDGPLERPSPPVPPVPPAFEVRDAPALSAIPAPSSGDLFFDFEGDPLYTEGDGRDLGLDYLFGMVDDNATFTAFWAHDFAAERTALVDFLEFVKLRRHTHPDLHIYHYAPYERTHLVSIAARHGVGEADVDQLLADGVLVDLYAIVKRAVRVGSHSYSIKKLEPLYMRNELREADVKAGDDSIIKYARASELRNTPDGTIDPESGVSAAHAAQAILDDLGDYNRYDCVSTLRLRDWLLEQAREQHITPAEIALDPEFEPARYEPSPLATHLAGLAGASSPANPRDSDHTALALASAAIDYNKREEKSFWIHHFLRATQPIESWEETRDLLLVDPHRSREASPWQPNQRGANFRRQVRLVGRAGAGSKFSVDASVFLMYDVPAPFAARSRIAGEREFRPARIVAVGDDGESLTVEESGVDGQTWNTFPLAVTPGAPPNSAALRAAIDEWASPIPRAWPTMPDNPALDILRRRPPRARGGLAPLDSAHDYVAAVTESVRRLDHSYLAVQGPPGTGKTYLASRAIERLVREHGYRIGVVAQSHAVVENVLNAVITAGLPTEQVGKACKPGSNTALHRFTVLANKDHMSRFTAPLSSSGFVVGGTAWDFCNVKRVPRGSLDLLVVDEAGQFSLASTVAASVSAANLLLLGDPQQLPQVSQGQHPEPVDTSALGWIADGHDVLPPDLGYFLAESRRMRAEVASPVSRLSYEGELHSHSTAAKREIDGVSPGVTAEAILHTGNTTESPQEAAAVVARVRSLIGRDFTDLEGGGPIAAAPRPLEQRDIIVVTPYNAQMHCVRDSLDAAGYPDVPVGTVDKFQGQEAAVAIVSLAASSAAAAPRGIEFLLLKNRLNVAISRAQVAAYLIYSPALCDAIPHTAAGVAQLSAFIRLVE